MSDKKNTNAIVGVLLFVLLHIILATLTIAVGAANVGLECSAPLAAWMIICGVVIIAYMGLCFYVARYFTNKATDDRFCVATTNFFGTLACTAFMLIWASVAVAWHSSNVCPTAGGTFKRTVLTMAVFAFLHTLIIAVLLVLIIRKCAKDGGAWNVVDQT